LEFSTIQILQIKDQLNYKITYDHEGRKVFLRYNNSDSHSLKWILCIKLINIILMSYLPKPLTLII